MDLLADDLSLTFECGTSALELLDLAGPDVPGVEILLPGGELGRHHQVRLAGQFGQQAHFGGAQHEILLGQYFELGPGLGIVEHDQHVSGANTVTFLDPQILDDAAIEVLYALAVALHLDHAIGDNGAIERREGRPRAEAAEEQSSDQPTAQCGSPVRIAGCLAAAGHAASSTRSKSSARRWHVSCS